MKANWLFFYSVTAALLFGCINEDPANSKLNDEIKQIDDYLASTGVTENILYDNASGMRIHVHEYGDNAPPHDGQEVTVVYVGMFIASGATFASGTIYHKNPNVSQA